MLVITDQWLYINIYCRNKGKICWQNKPLPDLPNIAINHYPINTVDFQQWNRKLLSSTFTVEQPSQNIIMILASNKEGRKKIQKKLIVKKKDPTLEYIKQLVIISVANQANFMA